MIIFNFILQDGFYRVGFTIKKLFLERCLQMWDIVFISKIVDRVDIFHVYLLKTMYLREYTDLVGVYQRYTASTYDMIFHLVPQLLSHQMAKKKA